MTKNELISQQTIRLKSIIDSIDQGEVSDQDIVDLKTFASLFVELMILSSPEVLTRAAFQVESRHHLRSVDRANRIGV